MTLPRRQRASASPPNNIKTNKPNRSSSSPTSDRLHLHHHQLPDIPSPVIWRYSSRSPDLSHLHSSSLLSMQPSSSSSSTSGPASSALSAIPSTSSPTHSSSSLTMSKSYVSPIRLALVLAVLVYFLVPSRLLHQISSHPGVASVSDAGRRVFKSIVKKNPTSTSTSTSTSTTATLPAPAVVRGECQIPQNGVSIVAACMNRHETLVKSLPTWLAINGVHQIVLVDWSSDPPLKSLVKPEQDSRIKLIRVNNEKSWVLSRAYNMAMNASSCTYVLRTDCDYAFEPNVLSVHSIKDTENSFFTGNWRAARDDNEAHLNGALIVKRDAFFSVGGYDERIQTYGWDDEDLYTRLEAKNFSRLNVSYDHVTHLVHDDESRKQSGVKFAQVQIDVNRLILNQLTPWSPSMHDGISSSGYHTVRDDGLSSATKSNTPVSVTSETNSNGRYVEMTAVQIPQPLEKLVSREQVENAWSLALGRRLADDHSIPWEIIAGMSANSRERLLRQLMRLQDTLDSAYANGTRTMAIRRGKIVDMPRKARVIIVHCQHGLGNRLRALGSALAFAKTSRRIPIVIWERDAHIAAALDELFEVGDRAMKAEEAQLGRDESESENESMKMEDVRNPLRKLVFISDFVPKWPFTKASDPSSPWYQFKLYNYMEMEPQAKKREVIENDIEKHIYYKGAYIMEAWDYTWWESANEQIRSLQPVEVIRKQLSKLESEGIRKAIGVHIRNKTLDYDIDDVDIKVVYGDDAVEEMEQWRKLSSVRTFVTEMERIIEEEDAGAKFYIASDTWYVLEVMEQRFGGDKIMSTKRQCDDRKAECVKFAVIDLYALSYTRRLLGSNWSSYTEAAQRLGGVKASLSGIDFGPNISNEQKELPKQQRQVQQEQQEQ